jgi:hypothetical protein
MTTRINDGNAHCPVVFEGFGFGSRGNGFDIGQI